MTVNTVLPTKAPRRVTQGGLGCLLSKLEMFEATTSYSKSRIPTKLLSIVAAATAFRGSGGGGRERGGSIELVQTVSQVDQLRQRAVAAERSGAMIDLTESDGEEEGEIRERDR